MSTHDAELARARRYWIDVSFYAFCGLVVLTWTIQGHGREATILGVVNYWGMPWRTGRQT